MNGYRKLLVLAINELVKRKLISLDGDDEKGGHVITDIAGENTVIAWHGIGFQELRVSVWWKYDHSRHPQANMTGPYREEFRTTRPLAKRKYYPNFVGVTVSGWVERKTGKHLQGHGHDRLFDIYTRRGEKKNLEALPDSIPNDFKTEGQFFI